MSKNEIIAARIQEQLKLERKFIPVYQQIINDYANRAAMSYQMTSSRVAALSELVDMPKDIEAALIETYLTAARRFDSLTKRQFGHLIKQEDDKSDLALISAVLAWALSVIDTSAASIVTTTRNIINTTIEVAEQAFTPTPQIAEEVQAKAGGAAARARAEAIAAIETHASANFASQRAAENIDHMLAAPMWKEWASAEDSRVRPDHSKGGGGDGQIVKLSESFLIGGSRMPWPGHPLAPLKQIIRCRCTVFYHTEHPQGLL